MALSLAAEKDNRFSVQSTSVLPQYELEDSLHGSETHHTNNSMTTTHAYEIHTPRAGTMHEVSGLGKPIVIPQSTNLFFIKTFSPFTRCYPPVLARLHNPIHPEEFLAFVDRLNHVFISNPVFQAAHVGGGMLMGSQILPAMAVGAVFQFGSVMASAGVSFVRVRKFMKEANSTIFAPRGLVCKIMTTKKMMAEVHFKETDDKGKLMLPPLEDMEDLGEYHPEAATEKEDGTKIEKPLERDPRLLRLKALRGYIQPLDFDVPANPIEESKLSKLGQAPVRWMNKKSMAKLDTAKAKSLKKREKNHGKVEAEELRTEHEIADLERRMEGLGESGKMELEMEKQHELERRDAAIAEIHKGTDKKIVKSYKKEEKVANRILWIVICNADGTSAEDDSLFQAGSGTDTEASSLHHH